jgi:flagellar biosynthesis/type III secretory pathway M-ring protein FliF/YscJ
MDADLLLICDPWVEGDKLMLILYLQRMIMIVPVHVFMLWSTKPSRRRLYVKLKNEENKEGTSKE